MKSPIRAAQNKQRGRQFDMPGLGGREDQISKIMYPFTPLLQELRGPPVAQSNTLGVHGNYFDF